MFFNDIEKGKFMLHKSSTLVVFFGMALSLSVNAHIDPQDIAITREKAYSVCPTEQLIAEAMPKYLKEQFPELEIEKNSFKVSEKNPFDFGLYAKSRVIESDGSHPHAHYPLFKFFLHKVSFKLKNGQEVILGSQGRARGSWALSRTNYDKVLMPDFGLSVAVPYIGTIKYKYPAEKYCVLDVQTDHAQLLMIDAHNHTPVAPAFAAPLIVKKLK